MQAGQQDLRGSQRKVHSSRLPVRTWTSSRGTSEKGIGESEGATVSRHHNLQLACRGSGSLLESSSVIRVAPERRRMQAVILDVVLALALLAAGCAVPVSGQGTNWPALIQAAKPAVVWILAETPEGTATGSGAIVSPDGYILTAAHVIAGASSIAVVVNESAEYRASVVQSDTEMDVAVLRIPASGLTWLALGDSDEVVMEDEIRVLGYPLPGAGVGYIAVAGIIQGKRTNGTYTLLQHNALTAGGHSGGPVINARGQVTGVHVAVLTQQPEYHLAVSVNDARTLISSGTLPSGPSPVQPSEFGVVRVPQDQPTLSAALRVASEHAEVELAPGTYSGDVSITKAVTISGGDGVIIVGVVSIVGSQGVQLRALEIRGGVTVRSSTDVLLESAEIRGARQEGVLVDASSVTLLNCLVLGSEKDGVSARAGARLNVSDSVVWGNSGTGIALYSSQAFIQQTIVAKNGRDGMRSASSTAYVEGTYFVRNGGWGIDSDVNSSTDGTENHAQANAVGASGGSIPLTLVVDDARVLIVPDDSATVGGAIDAAPSGAQVWIAEGTYQERLSVTRDLRLVGIGRVTIQNPDADWGENGMPASSGAAIAASNARLEVYGFTIDGGVVGISFSGTATGRVARCSFLGGNWRNSVGVLASGACHVEVSGSRFPVGWSWGLRSLERAIVVARACLFQASADAGVVATGLSEVDVESCSLTGNGSGAVAEDEAVLTLTHCTVSGSSHYGAWGLSAAAVRGDRNTMLSNGCDMAGNVEPSIRVPLMPAVADRVIFPSSNYPDLQSAVDGLLPGGTLILLSGDHSAGVCIGKRMRIEAASGASPVLVPRGDYTAALSLIRNADVELQGVEIRTKGFASVLVGGDARAQLAHVRVEGLDLSGACNVGMAESVLEYSLDARGSARFQISTCELARPYLHPFRVWGSADGAVADSSVKTSVTALGSAQLRFRNCSFSVPGWTALTLSEYCNSTITDCSFKGNSVAILLKGAATVTMEGAVVVSENQIGLQADDFRGEVRGQVQVMGNDTNASPRYPGLPWPEGLLVGEVAPKESGIVRVPRDCHTIGAALETAEPGDCVVIAEGDYFGEDSSMWVAKNLSLRGEGKVRIYACLVVADATVSIEGCTFIRDYGVETRGAASVSIRDCSFQTSYVGISAIEGSSGASPQVDVSACTFNLPASPSNRAVSVAGSGEIALANCTIRGGSVMATDDSWISITDCRLEGGKREGLALFVNARADVLRCSISDFAEDAGILLSGAASLDLRDSQVSRCRVNVAVWSQACFPWATAEDIASVPLGLAVRVSGTGNVISGGGASDLCPVYPGAPWPVGFVR